MELNTTKQQWQTQIHCIVKNLNIILLIISFMFVLFGCDKLNKSQNELKIFGINTEDIERIEIIHGNIILFPDKLQKDNLTLIEALNAFFVSTGDRIDVIDESLNITLTDAQGYAQNDVDNYYAYIVFSSPQILNFNNGSDSEYTNCDGVLFDINNTKLYWSVDGELKGTLGYKENTKSLDKELSTLVNQIENIFNDLDK